MSVKRGQLSRNLSITSTRGVSTGSDVSGGPRGDVGDFEYQVIKVSMAKILERG